MILTTNYTNLHSAIKFIPTLGDALGYYLRPFKGKDQELF
jgi:hypothetical protein